MSNDHKNKRERVTAITKVMALGDADLDSLCGSVYDRAGWALPPMEAFWRELSEVLDVAGTPVHVMVETGAGIKTADVIDGKVVILQG